MIVRNGLNLYPTEGMSRHDWLEFRKGYIGGSDLGTIMGVNKNYSIVELFYQKLGLLSSSEEINEAIYWGQKLEDPLLEAAQSLDLRDMTYMQNNPLRKISKFKYMVNNPSYPWLLGNVDGLENYSYRWYKADRIVEAKNISRQSAEMWETIPPYHFFQVQGYIRILDPMLRKKEALIVYLRDGRDLYGYEIPEVPNLAEQMLERSEDFSKRVAKGKEIIANTPNEDLQLTYLAAYEPPVDHSKAYERFWSELYKKKLNYVKIDGGDDLYEIAKKYKDCNAKIKEIDEEKQIHKNKILKALHDNGADVIKFGDLGQITYNKKLYVNVD